MSTTNNVPLNWYSSMKKKLRKIRIIFDIENLLWKSEIVIFWWLDLERMLICQFFFYEKVLFSTQLSSHLIRKLLKKSLFKPLCYYNHANFSIATCQTCVDLLKNFFYEKVLFSTQLSHHLMRKLLKNS